MKAAHYFCFGSFLLVAGASMTRNEFTRADTALFLFVAALNLYAAVWARKPVR